MIRVQQQDFDVGRELSALLDGVTRAGGVVIFVGLMRDFSDQTSVSSMTLEHYPGMTERELERIEAEARSRWPLDASLIVHRFGDFGPGDRIVLVITASAHRQAAFEANQFLVDWLKTRAPFWKLERGRDGEQWVGARVEDDAAAARWTNKR